MLLAARNLKFAYHTREGAVKALNGFSAEFPGGVPHFVCGPSGSGKTTLGYMLSGLFEPSSGDVMLTGVSDANKRDFAYVFQFAEDLFFEDTVADELRQITNGGNEKVQLVSARLGIGLSDIMMQHPHRLSAGYARLTAVALQMVRDPRVLILDEPTIGLDWRFHRRMTDALKNWVSPARILLVITHDLDLMRELEGQAWVMSEGSLAWSGEVKALLADESLLERFALRF
jgi:energy-coupling factor transport system ATP-binding protein